MGGLRSTNSEIVEAVLRGERRRRSRAVRRRPLVLIDVLVADLEELHLAGRQRVPPSYAPRLRSLTSALPASHRRDLRAGVTIVHLMDALFELRQRLLGVPSPDDQTSDAHDLGEATLAETAGQVERPAC
jgi:hypothetical protein